MTIGNPNEQSLFEHFEQTIHRASAIESLDHLVTQLLSRQEYDSAFDALNLKARVELGLPAIGRVQFDQTDLSKQYEERVTSACKQIGAAWLDRDDFAKAFYYFDLIGEHAAVRDRLEKLTANSGPTGDDEKFDMIIELCLGRLIHPVKGIELLIAQRGLCQAISVTEGLLGQCADKQIRSEVIKRLVRSLHHELFQNLVSDIEQREGKRPVGTKIEMLLANRAWLTENENYHVDTSHLHSVVRMARELEKSPELHQAIGMCEYGSVLSSRYHYQEATPFDQFYHDHRIYLRAIAGAEVTQALEHFRRKAEQVDPNEVGTLAIEIYVILLDRVGRSEQALDVAGTRLNGARLQDPNCPTINELCVKEKQFGRLAQFARKRNDIVAYAAARIMEQQKS